MDMLLTQLLAQKAAPAPTVTTGGASTPTAVVTTANVSASTESLPLLAEVSQALAGKQRRLGDLSKAVKKDPDQLRDELLRSGKFTITPKPAEWVKLVAA